MYKAEYSIKLLTIAGVYRPINLSLFLTRIFYHIFTIIVIIFFYSFNSTLCTYLILHSLHDVDEFAESLCWLITTSVICAKMINIILQQKKIFKLIHILNENSLQTSDAREEIMQENCDHIARRNTKYFLVICILTSSALAFGGLLKAKDDIDLPLKASFPYDYDRKLAFYLTYTYQALSVLIACLVTIGSETFVMTMMIQICSQLDIIMYRLQSLLFLSRDDSKTLVYSKKEAKIIKNCVLQHNYIYRFCGKLNSIFGIVLGIQFFGSVLNICTLIYSLSSKNVINDRTVIQSMALTTILFQIFLYCHFGNEVMVKSLEVANIIKVMDWTVLTRNTKHDLLLISVRASRPIILMSGSIIPITYDTFLSVLRTSYASYNLMKTINA